MIAEPDAAAYRTAISHFATGVAVVTTSAPRGPVGLTATAVSSLSLEPLLLLVCLDHGSRTLRVVRDTKRLAVNVLAQDQQPLAVAFASKAGEHEKFQGVGWTSTDGLPVLDGVIAWLVCNVRQLVPGGDHEIAIAEITAVGSPGGAPLVYYRSGYHALSP